MGVRSIRPPYVERTPGLVNGARGTVCEIVMDNSGKVAAKIMVQFDGIDEIQATERTKRKTSMCGLTRAGSLSSLLQRAKELRAWWRNERWNERKRPAQILRQVSSFTNRHKLICLC